jgi:hypothetical protein
MTTTYDLPVPDGAEADVWEDDTPQPYRVLYGVSRGVAGRDDVIVGTTAVQYRDGRIDDGTIEEPPLVYVETCSDSGLTSTEARQLAEHIIECADQIDGWAAR